MIFVPGWLGIEGINGGFAISFASIFGVIIGLIVVFVYNGLASRLDRILGGEGVLVRWSYTPELWREYTEKEYGMEKAEAVPKFYMVSAIALVVGVLFYVIDPEGGLFVLGAMVVLIVIIGLVAWASSRYVRGLNARGVGDAVIARNGVVLDGRFYYWGYFGTRLNKVSLRDEKGLMLLHFVTWSPSLTFGQSWDIRVPVPSGEEAKAKEIESELNQK
jgi:hypothetical protein